MDVLDVVVVPFFAAALVLVLAGVSKLRRPDGTVRALHAAGFPGGRGSVRILAAVELTLGAACLTRPSAALAVAMGALYLAFDAFLVMVIVRGAPGSSCGCIGSQDVPPNAVHVTLNLVAAGSAFAYAALAGGRADGIVGMAANLPMGGLALLVGVPLIAFLASLTAAHLSESMGSYRGRVA